LPSQKLKMRKTRLPLNKSAKLLFISFYLVKSLLPSFSEEISSNSSRQTSVNNSSVNNSSVNNSSVSDNSFSNGSTSRYTESQNSVSRNSDSTSFASRNPTSQDSAGQEATNKSSFVEKGIFSLDFGYMSAGLKNNGWGLGVSYERQLFDFASVKGTFSHITLKPDNDHDWITTVGLNADARIYPFNVGMKYLYFGYGIGTDFLMTGDEKNITYISHCPQIGWKQNLLDFVLLEALFGYRMNVTRADDFFIEKGIVKQGMEYGITFKFNIKKIWLWLKGGKKKDSGKNTNL
nr:hypothetical protein [Treponema sp.]